MENEQDEVRAARRRALADMARVSEEMGEYDTFIPPEEVHEKESR